MIEGKVEIYLSHREPDKHLLWLRPKLDRDGYDLLYWGAYGWTPLINCAECPFKKDDIPPAMPDNNKGDTVVKGDTLVSIPDKSMEGIEDTDNTTPNYGSSQTQKPSCGCPDVTN